MKVTKKQFKNCALRIMALLASREVNAEYANEWYQVIACDFVTGFADANIGDYEKAINYLLTLK